MGWRDSLGGISFLGNPRILLALVAVIAIIYFRRPISESLGSIGSGLGNFGTGFNTFISSVTSPKIEPTFGLKLTGVLGQAVDYAGQVVQGNIDNSKTSNQNTNGAPAGVSGGNNQAQSNQESNPAGSYIYDRLIGDQISFWNGLKNWGR